MLPGAQVGKSRYHQFGRTRLRDVARVVVIITFQHNSGVTDVAPFLINGLIRVSEYFKLLVLTAHEIAQCGAPALACSVCSVVLLLLCGRKGHLHIITFSFFTFKLCLTVLLLCKH